MEAGPLVTMLDETPAERVVAAIEALEAAVSAATDEEARGRPDWRAAALLWLDVGTAAAAVWQAARAAGEHCYTRREEKR